MHKPLAFAIALLWFGLSPGAACTAAEPAAQTPASPLPAILNALGGTWQLSIRFEPGSGLPSGTTGSGKEGWRAVAGGKALLSEESWKAGPVDVSLIGVLWWNYRENKLHAMDCNNQGKNICEPRDAAESVAVKWNGRELTIEEPERTPDGKSVTSRVSFKDITANSFSEVNSIALTPGNFQNMMTIHAVRSAEAAP